MTVKHIGIDPGTYTLVRATRETENKVKTKSMINAFLELDAERSGFLVNLLEKQKVPVLPYEGKRYVLGEKAVQLSYSMNVNYRRPMKDGILSVEEKDAFSLLAMMLRSLVGKDFEDNAMLCYCIPAAANNTKTNVGYHEKVLQGIFEKHRPDGKTLRVRSCNEASAIVYATCEDSGYTGIGISFGAGMVNVAYNLFGVEVFKFSLTNSGDWIDEQAAAMSGEKAVYINQAKKDFDLAQEPKNNVERAIRNHYEMMIENSITGIIDGIKNAGGKAHPDSPVNIVVAGGTASAKGFIELFRETLERKGGLPSSVPVNQITLAENNLETVATGCLVAAENMSEG